MLKDPAAAVAEAPAPAKRRTRTEELRLQLADAIVRGTLDPGAPLDETDLARQFGVSRTPIREAIRELSAVGLVRTRPHRGAVVALPTPQELEDMFAVMAELEALCAGLCALAMTPAERRALARLHAGMATMARRGSAEEYEEANGVFHGAIYTGAHNHYLSELAQLTRRRVAPFRRAQFQAEDRLRLSHEEHTRIVQAIARGDREEAAQAMRDHIGIVYRAYRRYARHR